MIHNRERLERRGAGKGFSIAAVVGAVVILLAIAAIVFYERSYSPKLPGGQSATTTAPLHTEKPESAKPPQQRQSG
jgi:hypothetical protein